jgi:DNA-binding transcriptional regulator YdaS (Cro superfamily)
MGTPASKKPPRDRTLRYIAKRKLWNAVAAECNIKPGAVRLWRKVPPLRVLAVERAIGRPRRLIRPDLYPEESNHKGGRYGQESKRNDQQSI